MHIYNICHMLVPPGVANMFGVAHNRECFDICVGEYSNPVHPFGSGCGEALITSVAMGTPDVCL